MIPVQARSVKSSPFAIRTPLPSRIDAVARGPYEADRLTERIQRLDPRLSAGRNEIIGIAGKANPRELLVDGLCGARRVGDEGDAPPLPAPLPKPLFGARIQGHSVMDDAPDVAED